MSTIDRDDRLSLLKSLYAARQPTIAPRKAKARPRHRQTPAKRVRSRAESPEEYVRRWTGPRTPSGMPKASYRGVGFNISTGEWDAKLRAKGERHFLGSFALEIDAARAYDAAVRRHKPTDKRSRPNFTDDGESTR